MSRALMFVLTSTLLIAHAAPLPAQTATEAKNWCEQAEASLTDKSGKTIRCAAVSKRCVLMNNYWCQKHDEKNPWKGTTSADGSDGLHDIDGHAIFDSADWSARAIARDIRSKYRKGLTTAVAIAPNYSPWCDTIGSKGENSGSGRSCKDGRASPRPGFSGPLCETPKSDTPSVSDCKPGCNCPPSVAALLVRGMGIDVNADMQLFDKDGKPKPNLSIFLRNLAVQEQGIYVREDVIAAGIAKLGQ